MKRRLIAVTLSLVMTMATVSETGAAAFISPDEAAVQVTAQTTETVEAEDAAEQQETVADSEEDIFSSGEENTDMSFQDEADDAFSSGTAGESDRQQEQIPTVATDTADTEGAVAVKAEDWISTENGFKLRKPVKDQNTDENNQNVDDVDNDETTDEPQSEPDAAVLNDTDAADGTDDGMSDTSAIADAAVTDTTDVTSADAEEAEFFTAADGIIKISTEYKGEFHTGYYLFDENGILVTGQAEVKQDTTVAAAETDGTDTSDEETEAQANQSYFTTVEEAVAYAGCEGEAITPYASNVGQQLKSTWKWTGTLFQYYDENGTLKTVEELEKEAKEAGTYTGYFEINGDYYCLDSDGKPRTGEITITANGETNLYYFNPKSEGIPGKMFHDGWLRADTSKGERWLYFIKGRDPKDIGKYYKRGIVATSIPNKGSGIYLLDSKGYVLKATMKKAANGAIYCTDSNGAIYRDKIVKYGNYRYYFTANGKRATWTRRWAKACDHYYYFGNSAGRIVEKHGWQKLVSTSGKFLGWLYFDSKGNHYTDKWTSSGYYFRPSGKLASGLTEINGRKYLFEVSSSTQHKGKVYKSTLVRYKNNWYLASYKGTLYKSNWKKFNGNYYYLKDYVIQTNQFMKKNGVNGYLDSNGKYTTGWVIVSNAKNLVRYIDPTGNGFARNKSMRINGILYYFDKNGYRITDLTSRYTGPYYVQVEQVNGVMTIYADAARTIPVKTIRVSVGLSGTPTPYGNFTLSRSLRWQPLMGPSWGQYGTHVDGAGMGGIFVHSVASSQKNAFNLPAGEYNKLGYPASHGCIRTCVADAKWVYEHCNGSPISIISGVYKADDALKGPLGKKPLTPLRGAGNFDPTDPSV